MKKTIFGLMVFCSFHAMASRPLEQLSEILPYGKHEGSNCSVSFVKAYGGDRINFWSVLNIVTARNPNLWINDIVGWAMEQSISEDTFFLKFKVLGGSDLEPSSIYKLQVKVMAENKTRVTLEKKSCFLFLCQREKSACTINL